MKYFSIILLAVGTIFSLFFIFIVRVATKKGALGNTSDNYVTAYFKKVEREIKLSGTDLNLEKYLILQFITPIFVGAFAAAFLNNAVGTIMLMAVVAMSPKILLEIKKTSADRKFEDRYVRALSQMASSLHSGKTIGQAIDAVASNDLLDGKIREDFRKMSSKIKLGTSIPQTFKDYADETGSKDAADVATAISIMIEVGGDPGKAVEKLANDIESRLLYRRKRESMMTEGKLISLASDLVPFLILGGTAILMPGTIQAYFTSPLLLAIFIAVIVVMLIGSVIVHKMLDDKVDVS